MHRIRCTCIETSVHAYKPVSMHISQCTCTEASVHAGGGVGIQLYCLHVGGGSHFKIFSGANYPLNYTGVKMMHLRYRQTTQGSNDTFEARPNYPQNYIGVKWWIWGSTELSYEPVVKWCIWGSTELFSELHRSQNTFEAQLNYLLNYTGV